MALARISVALPVLGLSYWNFASICQPRAAHSDNPEIKHACQNVHQKIWGKAGQPSALMEEECNAVEVKPGIDCQAGDCCEIVALEKVCRPTPTCSDQDCVAMCSWAESSTECSDRTWAVGDERPTGRDSYGMRAAESPCGSDCCRMAEPDVKCSTLTSSCPAGTVIADFPCPASGCTPEICCKESCEHQNSNNPGDEAWKSNHDQCPGEGSCGYHGFCEATCATSGFQCSNFEGFKSVGRLDRTVDWNREEAFLQRCCACAEGYRPTKDGKCSNEWTYALAEVSFKVSEEGRIDYWQFMKMGPANWEKQICKSFYDEQCPDCNCVFVHFDANDRKPETVDYKVIIHAEHGLTANAMLDALNGIRSKEFLKGLAENIDPNSPVIPHPLTLKVAKFQPRIVTPTSTTTPPTPPASSSTSVTTAAVSLVSITVPGEDEAFWISAEGRGTWKAELCQAFSEDQCPECSCVKVELPSRILSSPDVEQSAAVPNSDAADSGLHVTRRLEDATVTYRITIESGDGSSDAITAAEMKQAMSEVSSSEFLQRLAQRSGKDASSITVQPFETTITNEGSLPASAALSTLPASIMAFGFAALLVSY